MVDGEAAVANDQHACLSSQAASLPSREENSYGPIPSRYCAKVGFGSYAMKTQRISWLSPVLSYILVEKETMLDDWEGLVSVCSLFSRFQCLAPSELSESSARYLTVFQENVETNILSWQ